MMRTCVLLALFALVAGPAIAPARHERADVREMFHSSRYDGSADPWVMQLPDRYVMYRCRNNWQEGPYAPSPDVHDRIWRAESKDGLTGWTDDHAVLEGPHGAQDDLSCSPGVVIAPDGTWHLYYITASRYNMCGVVEMWHATAPNPGLLWTKLGKVWAVKTSDCSLLHPSPIIENGRIAVYFVVNWYGTARLWRMESWDGHQFTSPAPAGEIPESHNARVTQAGGALVVAYSNVTDGRDTQNTELRLASPLVPGPQVLLPRPNTFYSTYINAGNYLPGPPARIYFAGGVLLPGASDFSMDYTSTVGALVLHLNSRIQERTQHETQE